MDTQVKHSCPRWSCPADKCRYRTRIRAEYRNLGVISLEMIIKPMEADEITSKCYRKVKINES